MSVRVDVILNHAKREPRATRNPATPNSLQRGNKLRHVLPTLVQSPGSWINRPTEVHVGGGEWRHKPHIFRATDGVARTEGGSRKRG